MTATVDSNFWASHDKHTSELLTKSEQAAQHLRKIFKHLQSVNPELMTIEVQYDGSGDSGEIESIGYYKRPFSTVMYDPASEIDVTDSEPLSGELTNGMVKNRSFWNPETRSMVQQEPSPPTARELIDDLAWDVAYGKHPGFEINEGAYGTVVIYQDEDDEVQVQLTHNERIEEVCTTTSEL